LEKHHDDVFTFYFIGIVLLLISAIMTGAILSGNPFQIENLLIPAVFVGVALSFLVGTYLWNIKIEKK